MRLVLAIAFIVLLSSCTAPLSTIAEQHKEAMVCCKSYRQFGYEKLTLPGSKSFRIDKTSKASQFETGKSYFKAFELPRYSTPYNIRITSYRLLDLFHRGHIFYPAMIFLDENHLITRRIMRPHFSYIRTDRSESWMPSKKLLGEVRMTGENRNEKYMILLTTEEFLGGANEDKLLFRIPLIFPKGTVPVPHSPMGKFKVELFESGT